MPFGSCTYISNVAPSSLSWGQLIWAHFNQFAHIQIFRKESCCSELRFSHIYSCSKFDNFLCLHHDCYDFNETELIYKDLTRWLLVCPHHNSYFTTYKPYIAIK